MSSTPNPTSAEGGPRRRSVAAASDGSSGGQSSAASGVPSTPPVLSKSGSFSAAPAPVLEINSSTKWRNFAVRSLATFVMLGAFYLFLIGGHFALTVLVVLIVAVMFKEVSNLGAKWAKEKNLPGFRMLHWHLLLTTILGFLYRQFYKPILPLAEMNPLWSKFLANFHFFIFCMYCFGFVWFVMSLKKPLYRYQFGQLAWTVVTLILCVFPASYVIANLFEGIIWFILPALLVICNDCTAYLFGFFFGRTPLIRLSPKKTWEGFIGATVSTLAIGFMLPVYMASSPDYICPKKDFMTPVNCTPSASWGSHFLYQTHDVPTFLQPILQKQTVEILPLQFHALSLAAFASIIAPFGGFMASGFKRAFKIKDFADTIPGHGGITDRMDCQLLMGAFTWAYLTTFVNPFDPVASLLGRVYSLSPEIQLHIYNQLGDHLRIAGQQLP